MAVCRGEEGDDDDLRLSIAGIRHARSILASSPLKELVDHELLPGAQIVSDAELAEHCKRTVKTNYHPVGTCRMGRDSDPAAVLLPDLCVRGTTALRVLDASMMPNIVSGNTNAAVLAVADKAVDIMMGITHLPPRGAARPRTDLEAQST